MSASSESRTSGSLRTLSNDLAAAVERASASVVAVHARPRIPASGIYWRDGIIVATSHTIRKEHEIAVTMPNGERAVAQLVGRDGGTDLALLRLDDAPARSLATVADRASDALRVGALVLAVGRPGASVTTSLGVISAVADRWRTWSGGEIDKLVRLDLSVYDGFSGGALVDAEGQVLGVNCSALARGTPLTIPNATVERVVDALLTRGHVSRAYLGVAMQPVQLTRAVEDRLGLGENARGVLVVMVESDSPADKAGLLVGDVIVAAAGEPMAEPQDIAELLGADRVGTTLDLDVVRGGERRELKITVGERGPSADVRHRRRQ